MAISVTRAVILTRPPARPNAALDDVLHAQVLPNAAQIAGLVAVLEGGVACDDDEFVEAEQLSNDVLGDAVAEIFLGRVTTHVDEWQDHNRRLVGQRKYRLLLGFARRYLHPIHAHGLRNVLQFLPP